jgi:hypothetical protein
VGGHLLKNGTFGLLDFDLVGRTVVAEGFDQKDAVRQVSDQSLDVAESYRREDPTFINGMIHHRL